MLERIFQRSQRALRAFYGLGPNQMGASDTILPVLDLDWLLRTSDDVELVNVQIVAVTPNQAARAAWTPARDGYYAVHFVGLTTQGPATSGTYRIQAYAELIQATATFQFPLFDTLSGVVQSRPAQGFARFGSFFPTPFVITVKGVNAETVVGEIFNEAASVGNATLSLTVGYRYLPLAP